MKEKVKRGDKMYNPSPLKVIKINSPADRAAERFGTALFIILSGGFQDAYTYCVRDNVFANAQTGNIVLLSTAAFNGNWGGVLKYLIPVSAFILGIFAAEIIHINLGKFEKFHWRQIILIAEIVILFTVGFIPENLDFLANAAVSFVCALQVQSFHKIRGHAYASTMCIGNLRSGTEALCTYFRTRDKAILQKAATYFGVILVFAIGSGLGFILSSVLGNKAVWICCGLLTVSLVAMFKIER